jgi:hypothetical protein
MSVLSGRTLGGLESGNDRGRPSTAKWSAVTLEFRETM